MKLKLQMVRCNQISFNVCEECNLRCLGQRNEADAYSLQGHILEGYNLS